MRQQHRTHYSFAHLLSAADVEAAAPGLRRCEGLTVIAAAGVALAHHAEAGAVHGSVVQAAPPPAAGRRVEGLSCHRYWL